MNVLFTSVGRRCLLVDYLKKTLQKYNGKVFAADCSKTASGLYNADEALIVPRITDPNYVEHLIQICKKHNIKAIIPLIDPELSILAKEKEKFDREGILCVVSNYGAVETCFDKFEFYKFLTQNGFKTIKTFSDLQKVILALEQNEIQFPLILKPRKGSASIGITKVDTIEKLMALWDENLIAQEFVDGQEFGIDVYIDFMTKEVVSVFPKKKIEMRAGETDKAVSTKNQEAIQIAKEIVTKLGLVGPIDIDCFKTENGFVISEINPRLGGGYPLAHECGVNAMDMIVKNANKEINTVVENFVVGRYMFKNDTVCIKNEEELK